MFIIILIVIFIIILFKNHNKKLIKNNIYIPDDIKQTIIKKKSNKIHIWQTKGHDGRLEFMYKPVINSLIEFIKEININILIEYKNENYNNDEIESNNILIWVGCMEVPDFNYFKNKNIYTIYYNTEPDFTNPDSNEIWTYSKYLFDKYIKNDNQIIRFFPIICEKTDYTIPYHLKNDNNLKLIFMGNFIFRPEKKEILNSNQLIRDNLIEIFDLWNDKDYNNFINNKPNIFISLTKTDTKSIINVLPSIRLNKLLSHKCIIISENTNDIDEEYYKDIIYFCDINNIKNIYDFLMKKTAKELEIESNIKYNKFYNIFNSKNIINLILQK
jgi:hypothetical protein